MRMRYSRRQKMDADEVKKMPSDSAEEGNGGRDPPAEISSSAGRDENPANEAAAQPLRGMGLERGSSFEDDGDSAPRVSSPPQRGRAQEVAGKREGAGQESSKQLAGSSKLEDQINLQHLVELMKIFHEADENGSDGLDIDEFKAAFGQILGKGKKDQQMAAMFMKIDTNCDGTVDWDEFCTFMLLEYQEKDLMEGEKLPLFPYPLKVLPNPHRDNITSILPLPLPNRPGNQSGSGQLESADGRFISVCKDGTVCFWRSNHSLQRMVQVESTRSRFTWVTDLVVMANINKLMVSFTDNTLAVYDMMTFDLQQQVVGLRNCILGLYYWYDQKAPDKAVLVFGDSGGGLGTFDFSSATSNLFPTDPSSCSQDVPVITFSELIHYPTKSMTATYLPGIHGDWVTRVQYCPYMDLCMSCSNDSGCSLHLVDPRGRKEGIVFSVRKGVSSFDYSRELNVIATGGLDRILRLWNPYIPAKPTTVLKGHTSAIVHVVLHSKYGEALSFSRDLELRVWSVQDQVCLQVCHRFQELLPQPPSAFCLHPRTGALLIGTNQLGLLEPCRDEEIRTEVGGRKRGKTLTHERPLTAALYNSQFNQVVSGCQGGVVSVWDLDNGEKTMQFSRCHGDMELTAMTFDPSGRRLITGGRDGSLKIWNFNNGACLNVLQSKSTLEVTSLCFLKQRIFVGGWNQMLSAYSDTRDADGSIPKCFGSGEHREDILCLAGQEPNLLASASYDGDILLWNIDSERCVGRLNAGCQETRRPRPVFGCTGRRHVAMAHLPVRRRRPEGGEQAAETKESSEQSMLHRDKDERAIEKVLFLKLREPSPTVGSLVACGSGGWVQFWNTSGGGLVGEFNVWNTQRHALSPSKRGLHSVTAMHVNENETLLYTGNSLGYLQLWDISCYCLHKEETTPTVDKTPPPLKLAWRSHLLSVVSIDTGEEVGVVITASTDCTVRLWTTKGCYIGTFGQRAAWQVPMATPRSQGSNIINLIPPDLHRSSSFETLNIVSGAVKSKWTLARNLMRALRINGPSEPDGNHDDQDCTSSEEVLGRCYERRTRVRTLQEKQPLTQREVGTFAIYSSLLCPELAEPSEIQPPLKAQSQGTGINSADDRSRFGCGVGPKGNHTHIEASLLQGVWHQQRRMTVT